jgi:hypothetical protein
VENCFFEHGMLNTFTGIELLLSCIQELLTGVTRFVGVTVKTFVLSLGASVGLMLAFAGEAGAANAWYASSCNRWFLDGAWWRILLYLGNCVFVLGQYRLPIAQYWRALIVQLIAYEVQFQVFNGMGQIHVKDHLDTAASNMTGAVSGVCAAALISWIVNVSGDFFRARLLQENASNNTRLGDFYFQFLCILQKAVYHCGIGRPSDIMKFDVEEKLKVWRTELKDPHHPRDQIEFPPQEENVLLDAIIGTQDINTWSILMPAVYQLVPGSIIAKLWFSAIFYENPYLKEGDENPDSQESVFANLMVISTSIALGLIIGFSLFQSVIYIVGRSCFRRDEERKNDQEDNFKLGRRYISQKQGLMEGMYTVVHDADDDPDSMGVTESEEGRSLFSSSNGTHDEPQTPDTRNTI